jgi:hypothetical protein
LTVLEGAGHGARTASWPRWGGTDSQKRKTFTRI